MLLRPESPARFKLIPRYTSYPVPWSQMFFFIFHSMRELRESREAAKTGREAALSQLSHTVNIIIINMGEKSKKPLGLG